ncbi:MAG: HD domain-containing protein [Lachnospiraceae bacterium]|nr:HD domain-containing protein [Lachnospiraceae bacterium]
MIDEAEHFKHLTECLNQIMVARSIDTLAHIRYVQGYTRILATEYARLHPRARMSSQKIDWIVDAAGLHDMGKLMLPDSLLHKVGRQSRLEREWMKQHTVLGCEMVDLLFDFRGTDFCRICRNVCLYHHEIYDGSGYPKGYKRDKIPTEAQLVALADMYEVLLHYEPEKNTFPKEKVYYMLMNGKCGELSPKMKECLENTKERLETYRLETEQN